MECATATALLSVPPVMPLVARAREQAYVFVVLLSSTLKLTRTPCLRRPNFITQTYPPTAKDFTEPSRHHVRFHPGADNYLLPARRPPPVSCNRRGVRRATVHRIDYAPAGFPMRHDGHSLQGRGGHRNVGAQATRARHGHRTRVDRQGGGAGEGEGHVLEVRVRGHGGDVREGMVSLTLLNVCICAYSKYFANGR